MKKRKMLLVAIAMYVCPLLLVGCFGGNSGNEENVEQIDDATVNELFDSMVVQLERFYDVEETGDVYADDFGKMATSFKQVYDNNPKHMKAGVGYIVSSVANLNHNQALQEVADSMDSYINSLFDYWDGTDEWGAAEVAQSRKESKLFSNAYRNGGVEGLGTAMLAHTPKMMRGRANMPNFPKMITMSKIQSLVESEIIPVLNGAIDVVEKLEDESVGSLLITYEEDTFEIDQGEMYLADASLRLLRYALLWVTTYNYDIETPDGQGLHAFIDKMMELEEETESFDGIVYSLSPDGDTLYRDNLWFNSSDKEMYEYIYDVLAHNLKRSEFLGLRSQNHAKMYTDIQAIPVKLKKAIQFIKAETDNQENDILKIADIDELSAEMVDIADEMTDMNFSTDFADNFRTPVAMADFISEILSGPYTFKESVEGVDFDYTIDLSKYYTNPHQNIQEWLPLYKLSGKENCIAETASEGWPSEVTSSSFTLWDGDSVSIDPSLIESINGSTVTLKKAYSVEVSRTKRRDFMPFVLVDTNGDAIADNYDEVEDAIFSDENFLHFEDYTFNGIFPNMTRAKWIDLFQQLYEI